MEFRKLDEIIEFNPKENIDKKELAKKISMESLSCFTKYIKYYSLEKYNGGMKFRNGDTLLARITPCLENGKTAKVTILDENEVGFGSTEYIVMRSKKKISDEDFIFYLTISPKFRDIAIKSMTGTSGRQRVQLDVVKNTQMLIPGYQEQVKIGKILSSIDKKIELNSKMNDNLHKIAENNFLEISKNGHDTKLEDLIFEIQSGSREKGGAVASGIPSIGAEKIEKLGVYDFNGEKYISEDYFNKMKKGMVNSGDVLLYKDGAYTGKVSMALNNYPHKKCAVNEHVFILRTKNNWANCYLYFLLYNSKIQKQIQKIASSKAAQPGLNQNEVKGVKVSIPNKDDIIKFESNMKIIVEKIIQNSIENRNLEQIRDILLPKLMDGEIDLRKV